MDSSNQLAPQGVAGRSNARRRAIERNLYRFPRRFRPAIAAMAARNPCLADLAVSFPALLAVVTLGRPELDRDALAEAVCRGVPLKTLARMAGLPFWARRLPPEAFDRRPGGLPASDIFSKRVPNVMPRRARHAAAWLRAVEYAARFSHEAFALWTAKHHVELLMDGARRRRTRWRLLALWAWFSMADGTLGQRLAARRWTPDITPKRAIEAADEWLWSVELHISLPLAEGLPSWFTEKEVDGYGFVYLGSSAEIADEADAMGNCLKTYGYPVNQNRSRLWSMRRNGERVATLSIAPRDGAGFVILEQIAARNNEEVIREVAVAARRWCDSHDATALDPALTAYNGHGQDARKWQELFRPYWLAKKRIPDWLRLKPDAGKLWRGERM